ncbi:MAG: hypothetical protein K2X37_09840 [Chitinophagaceae bacterium]|nr:hypothetical protein [Chitinophagaceae bacterium]
MSKELFEHIENKIKAAAENIAPAFTPAAWEAMEKKLDDDERKRRIIFFWWLPIIGLLGVGILYYLLFTSNEEKPSLSGTNSTSLFTKDQKSIATQATTSTQSNTVQLNRSVTDSFTNINLIRNSLKKNTNRNQILHVDIQQAVVDTLASTVEASEVSPAITTTKSDLDTLNKKIIPHIISPVSTDSLVQTDSAIPAKKDTVNKRNNKFYISLAVGITRGSASFIGESKTEPAYGFGIGYQFNRKISLQSGFYVSRKTYDANPSQYYVKPGSYLSTLQLTTINANCLVYEVPLSLRFIVTEKQKSMFYVSGGLSTYFMKQEAYNYNYIRNGTNYAYEKEYQGNQHLFSITSFSIGYARKLNNRILLFAEPYWQMPLKGIGEGKVNVFSSGIWTGIIIRK